MTRSFDNLPPVGPEDDNPNSADDGSPTAGSPRQPRRRRRLKTVAAGIVLGAAVALLGLLLILVIYNRGQPPFMTAAEFESAEARWQEHGLASYDMDLEVSFAQPESLHVEVRKSEVAAMTVNGAPAPKYVYDSWTVAGLFDVIRRDSESNEGKSKSPADLQPPRWLQQAEFDPELGYPRRYRRTELPAGQAIEWQITRFHGVE